MSATARLKILHVITALNHGGAETMLSKLVREARQARRHQDHIIVSMIAPGAVGRQLIADGFPVHCLNMRQGFPTPLALLRLAALLRQINPDIVQGWMYHGNVAASLAHKFARFPTPLIWNVRHSLSNIAHERLTSALNIRLGALISRWPQTIIYNAQIAVAQHQRVGFSCKSVSVIPNGFDTVGFRPDATARGRLVTEHRIDPHTIIVGMIARVDPMKSHTTLIEAARLARLGGQDIHLLLCGMGTDRLPGHLQEQLTASLPANRISLLGDRRDVKEWLPGLDIAALSSAWGEGFPNVLGEAMACGLPCVATDVGDSGHILEHVGLVVPPLDPCALSKAFISLCEAGEQGRQKMGRLARARAETEYDLGSICSRYSALYSATVAKQRDPFRGLEAQETNQCAG